MIKHRHQQQGFAALETVLILVIVAGVAGIGYWVYKQRQTQVGNGGSSNISTQTATGQLPAIKVGTSDGIEQLAQQDGQSEASIDSKYEKQAQSQATSTSQSLTGLAGAYNESNF